MPPASDKIELARAVALIGEALNEARRKIETAYQDVRLTFGEVVLTGVPKLVGGKLHLDFDEPEHVARIEVPIRMERLE